MQGGPNLAGAVQSEPAVPLVPDPAGSVTEAVPSVIDAAKEAANSLDQFTRFGNGTTPLVADVPAPIAQVPGDVSIGSNAERIGTVADLLLTEAKQAPDSGVAANSTANPTAEKATQPKTAEELMEGLSAAKKTIEDLEAYLKEEAAKKVTV
jgi:hypothetical protein